MNKYTKFFSFLSQTSVAVVLGLAMLFAVPANAQIGMEPFGLDKTDPKATGWFKYVVSAGDTINDFVLLTNLGKEDVTVDLQSNDAMFTEDGAFTIVSNEVEDTQVGSWVKIDNNTVVVPAERSLKVPFKIEIPANAKPGEYAGGLSVLPIDTSNPNAPLAVKTRIGNRIYIMVKGGDFNVSADVKDLGIMNPKMTDFKDQVRRRNFITKENMTFKITTNNTGNVFSNLVGTFKYTLPDGKTQESKFTRTLGQGTGERVYYIESGVPYQVGETKLEVSYELKPQSSYKDALDYKYTNEKATLTTSINLTQADIDEFDKALAAVEKPKPVTPNQQTNQNNSLVIETEEKAPEVKKDDNNNLIIYIGAGVGLLLLILIGLVAFKIFSDKKKTSKDESVEATSAKPSNTVKK